MPNKQMGHSLRIFVFFIFFLVCIRVSTCLYGPYGRAKRM